MTTRSRLHTSCGRLALLAILCSASASAQSPRGADTSTAGSVADSLIVLDRLSARVRAQAGDTAAWHQLGMVAWALFARTKGSERLPGLDPTRLGRLADSSLRIAADLAPADIRYRLDAGRFLLASGVPIARTAARRQFEQAITVARKSAVRSLHAEAALEYARTLWWGYDGSANRRLPIGQGTPPRSVADAMRPISADAAEALNQIAMLDAAADLIAAQGGGRPGVGIATVSPQQVAQALGGADVTPQLGTGTQGSFKAAGALLESSTQKLDADVAGAVDFQRAYDCFREAYLAEPSHPGAFRGLAMVFADRSLWRELESLARNHVRAFPHDSLAWMTLGLAAHRQQKDALARAAFDSAFGLLGASERDRLDNWSRVLRPVDAEAAADASGAQRASRQRLYWMLASPVWADATDRTHIEFLSRVTFAELRWTVEEFDLRGADTDRGDKYVRYGPPDQVTVISPVAAQISEITTFWSYNSGLLFAFRGMPTFLTSHTAGEDATLVQGLEHAVPARWDNTPAPVTDSLDARVARFRVSPGLLDVLIAARLNAPDSIRKSMSVGGDVQRYFWIVAPGAARTYRNNGPVDTAGVYTWSQRVESANLVYRVEEFGATASRAGRATGALEANATSFPPLGFGISDVLLATRVTAPGGTARRWSDLRIAPLAGPIASGGMLSVVWESYEMGSQDGQAHYDVSITIEREASAAGRVAARIADALASVVRVQTATDRVVNAFERTVAHGPALVDHITLALDKTPAGSYTLALAITDLVTGKKATRVTHFAIRE